MQNISRNLNISKRLLNKSQFLLGPRGTGKSWLIRNQLSGIKTYNLLMADTFAKLAQRPQRIREELQEGDTTIVIDEVQKLPELLDEVHLLIEEKNIRFLLTGSSARRLKRGGANLLAGRAQLCKFHPFTWSELGEKFDLQRALQFGLLPAIYFSAEPVLDLVSYTGMYLQEEIANESLSRNLPAFARFLEVAALHSGTIINYTNVANDSQVKLSTVRDYYQILEDTLIGTQLPALKGSRRKALGVSKFYFFDIGVTRALQQRQALERNSSEYGMALEAFLFQELSAFNDYCHAGMLPLHYWRTSSGYEVDFIVANSVGIEVKASQNVTERDLRGIRALAEEHPLRRQIVVCLEATRRKVEEVEILPLNEFLEELWGGDFVK